MGSSPSIEFNHDPEPIRLFNAPWMEFFTHVHPVAVLVIWIPVVVGFLVVGMLRRASAGTTICGVVLGLFVWTLAEYLLHRFVFHFRPRSPRQERIAFLFHGVHHLQPKIKTRLVMPPAASIPLALVFLALFWVVLALALGRADWFFPTFAAFIAGYIVYDMVHYSTHHLPMRKGAWKRLKQHHMVHHYKRPDLRYGVSSPFWDVVFGTLER